MDISHAMRFDGELSIGETVMVRWGYGSGFRASGRGVIVKLHPKSLHVKLDHPVMHNNKVGWEAGFVLTGIPRCRYDTLARWNDEHGVFPIDVV